MDLFLAFLSLIVACYALAKPDGTMMESPRQCVPSLTTTTVSATVTVSFTNTIVTTVSPPASSPTCSAPPSGKVTILVAVKRGAAFHLKPLTAGSQAFFVGANTIPSTFCPSVVTQSGGVCPPGNVTGIHGCSMAVEVPGGQMIYLDPSGALRYTQAHSAFIPVGSIVCPLIFGTTAVPGLSCVTVNSSRSHGLMACPLEGYWTNNSTNWQVFVDGPNVIVPNGAPSTCVPFETLAIDVDIGSPFAAWQYT